MRNLPFITSECLQFRRSRLWLVELGAFLACGLFAAWPAAAQQTQCKVSKAGYDQVWPGMPYRQVASVFGCDGFLVSRTRNGPFETSTLMWSANGAPGARITIVLDRDKLAGKSQIGLK